jgi:hypothetical protein
MEKIMCYSRKKTQITPNELDKMKKGVQDGSIHNWGTKKRKFFLEVS